MARRSIPEDEMLWPLSMPPQLPTKDEEIKIAKLDMMQCYIVVIWQRVWQTKTNGQRNSF